MGYSIKAFVQKIKIKHQINRNLKRNGFNRNQFKKQMKEYMNRQLDINEILARECSDSIVVDTYEYCMRKCNWDTSLIEDGCIKDFLLCVIFDAEVDNGGISQFLSNSTGDMWEETLAALNKINSKQADIFSQVLKWFPESNIPKDREQRNNLIDNFNADISENLYELDSLIYNSDNTQNYYDYLMAHKSNFLNY